MTIHPSKNYWLTSGCGRVEIQVPGQLILDLSGPGSVDDAAQYWAKALDWTDTDESALIEDLKEYGCEWDYADSDLNRQRFLWTSSGSIYDSEDPDQSLAD